MAKVVEYSGLTQRQFAAETDLAYSTVSLCSLGKIEMTIRTARKIKQRFPEISEAFLLGQSREMFEKLDTESVKIDTNIEMARLDAGNRRLQLIEKLTEDLKTASSENAETIRAILANLLNHT